MQIKQLYKLSFFIFFALCNVIHYNISVKRKRDRAHDSIRGAKKSKPKVER